MCIFLVAHYCTKFSQDFMRTIQYSQCTFTICITHYCISVVVSWFCRFLKNVSLQNFEFTIEFLFCQWTKSNFLLNYRYMGWFSLYFFIFNIVCIAKCFLVAENAGCVCVSKCIWPASCWTALLHITRLIFAVDWNLSNLPQLGMSVLWWISGVDGLTRFTLSTCIVIHFLETIGQICNLDEIYWAD
jgi:hypothetical protein